MLLTQESLPPTTNDLNIAHKLWFGVSIPDRVDNAVVADCPVYTVNPVFPESQNFVAKWNVHLFLKANAFENKRMYSTSKMCIS